jgi:hypothetical protein
MKHSEIQEHSLRKVQVAQRGLNRNPKGFLRENGDGGPREFGEAAEAPYLPDPPAKTAGKATETARPEALAPYILEVEMNCDQCGGSGFDPGGLDPCGPEPCPVCHGAKTQIVIRNYLAEAFHLAASPESTRPIERQHLVAVIQHCREAVSALVVLPEVALRCSKFTRSRGSANQTTEMKRRKEDVTFSPQWA